MFIIIGATELSRVKIFAIRPVFVLRQLSESLAPTQENSKKAMRDFSRLREAVRSKRGVRTRRMGYSRGATKRIAVSILAAVSTTLMVSAPSVAGARNQESLEACFIASGLKYNLDPQLLWSIAMVESRGRANAINVNQGEKVTEDLGVMQVNSSWLPALAKYSITRERLLKEPCLNIDVGAWILAGTIARYGWQWNAVGAYNAACSKMKGPDCDKARKRYTDQVWRWYSSADPAVLVR